jgi:LmbE family N-acetylglucosaminyl deacetylase
MSPRKLKLTCILAHPDDESMGTGGILAKYSHEGIGTSLVTATGGERGWFGDPADYPGPEELAAIRSVELKAAADVLGLGRIEQLGFEDGQLNQAEPLEVIRPIVGHLRAEQPQVVVTFDPFGTYGHPDHIAISQLAMSAVMAAADDEFEGSLGPSHRVEKFYYFAETQEKLDIYQQAFGELAMQVDGTTRRAIGWKSWALTTKIDTSEFQDQIWQAIQCHQTQLPNLQALLSLPEDVRRQLWSETNLYRVFSLVSAGRQAETDLFAGLR